ncbi:MAG: hypothetical protein ACYCX2_02190 [Christensenellales bacterium]
MTKRQKSAFELFKEDLKDAIRIPGKRDLISEDMENDMSLMRPEFCHPQKSRRD